MNSRTSSHDSSRRCAAHSHVHPVTLVSRILLGMIAVLSALSNREMALLVWSMVGLIFAMRVAGPQVQGVLRAFFVRAIFMSLMLLGAYVSTVVFALYKYGFWHPDLLKDTIIWFVVTATVTLCDSVNKGKENLKFFRDLLFDNLKVAVALEFVIDTFVMPLGWELVLVPVAFALGAFNAIADSRDENSVTRKPINFLIGCMSLVILSYAVFELITGFREFSTVATLREFLLAPILRASCLPFFLAFALWIGYQELFIRVELWMRDKPGLCRIAKLQCLRTCTVHFDRLAKLKGKFYLELQESDSPVAVSEIVGRYAYPAPIDPADVLTGEVVAARLIPFELASNGAAAQMVLIDWKNTSNRAIAAAWAEITPFDEQGKKLEGGSPEQCVFSYEDNNMEKIEPGETYIEPDGLGFVLFPMIHSWANHVEVRMVRFEADCRDAR